MAFISKFVKTVRNHWKKSTFAALALSYGIAYAKEYYETEALMRVYCEKAASYGSQPISVDEDPKTITVILNPNANKRKAAKLFDKYCAPILNVAGICVNVVQTESEGHAKTLMEKLSDCEAIVVAGGDGTLSEVITGLFRRADSQNALLLPIGVLPLGKINTLGKSLFPGGSHLEIVRSLADASMAVIQEVTRPIDVMKIEVLDQEDHRKPIYALTEIRWGAYRDAKAKQEKYWYFGPLRKYATYLINGYKSSLSWVCEANILYSPPCEGCSNCRTDPQVSERWYNRFINHKNQNSATKFSNITNEYCTELLERKIKTSDLKLTTLNTVSSKIDGPPKLKLNLGPEKVDYLEFVAQGWKSEKGEERDVKECIEARQVELIPNKEENEKWFSIDNEDFEVKPVRVTLLPRVVHMFCKKEDVFLG